MQDSERAFVSQLESLLLLTLSRPVPTFILNVLLPIVCPYGGFPRLYMSPSPVTFNRTLMESSINTLIYSLGLIWTYRYVASF